MAEWLDVKGKNGKEAPLLPGNHQRPAKSPGDFACNFAGRMQSEFRETTPWPDNFGPRECPHTISVHKLVHTTSPTAFTAMHQEGVFVIKAGKARKTLLPLAWFSAVPDQANVAAGKDALRENVYAHYFAAGKNPTEAEAKAKIKPSHYLDGFFTSPAFDAGRCRYGLCSLTVNLQNLLQSYSKTRGCELANIKLKVFLTHQFPKETELAILVCREQDKDVLVRESLYIGSLDDVPETVADLHCDPITGPFVTIQRDEQGNVTGLQWAVFSTSTSYQRFCNHGTIDDSTRLHQGTRTWDALHVAFYVPDQKDPVGLCVPANQVEVAAVRIGEPWLGGAEKSNHKGARAAVAAAIDAGAQDNFVVRAAAAAAAAADADEAFGDRDHAAASLAVADALNAASCATDVVMKHGTGVAEVIAAAAYAKEAARICYGIAVTAADDMAVDAAAAAGTDS